MPGPWERYATPASTASASGPWEKYGAPPPTATPEQPPEAGAWAGLKRGASNIIHTPGAVWDAFTKPPQDDQEKLAATLPVNGQQLPPAVALGLHRLIVAPLVQESQRADVYQKQATKSTETPDVSGIDTSLLGRTPQEKAQHLANIHRLASMFPIVGPIAGDLTERFLGIGAHEGQPDVSGAATELGTYIAAPKAAEEVGGAVIKGGAKAVESAKDYTPSGNIPKLALKTVTGMVPGSKFFNATRSPTLSEWVTALKPDAQMTLFKNTPKLGDMPVSPETHPATLAALQEPAPTESPANGPSTIPRTTSGEGVINQALTALDKPTLLRIARSRGINTTQEANLVASKAEASLVKKISADMSPDEIDEARELGLELSRNKPVQGLEVSRQAGQGAWHYKVVKQFFPDVELPKAMAARAQATIAQRPDYSATYQQAAKSSLPANASDAQVKAKAVDLQAQDENLEALLKESIRQTKAKK